MSVCVQSMLESGKHEMSTVLYEICLTSDDKIHSTLILNPYLALILGNMASIIPRMLLALNQSIELILEIKNLVYKVELFPFPTKS